MLEARSQALDATCDTVGAHVGAHLPHPHRPSCSHVVTLVCKQWRRLFFQAPELWRSLVIWESASWTCTAPYERLSSDTAAAAAAWFRAKLALVRRVGPLAAQAQLGENNFDELGRHAGEERALVQLLSAFSPAALTRLELEQCTELEPAVAASLGALTALHTLRCASFSLLDPKLLPGLPRLVELSLEASVLPAWDAATLHRLARLTSLRLLGGQMEPASLHPLTVLSNLRELEVTRLAPWRDDAGIVEGSLAAPPASAFPYLQRLTLHSDWLTVRGAGSPPCSLPCPVMHQLVLPPNPPPTPARRTPAAAGTRRATAFDRCPFCGGDPNDSAAPLPGRQQPLAGDACQRGSAEVLQHRRDSEGPACPPLGRRAPAPAWLRRCGARSGGGAAARRHAPHPGWG